MNKILFSVLSMICFISFSCSDNNDPTEPISSVNTIEGKWICILNQDANCADSMNNYFFDEFSMSPCTEAGVECVYLEFEFNAETLTAFSNFSQANQDLEEAIEIADYTIESDSLELCVEFMSSIFGIEESTCVNISFSLIDDGDGLRLEYINPIFEGCEKTQVFKRG